MSRLGTCFRCHSVGVVVEDDHPCGTVGGVHLYPSFTVPLCLGCHRLRSIVDRRVGVEGGEGVGAWLVVRRLAAWDGLLATAHRPIVFPAQLLAQRAGIEEDVALMISRAGET